MSVGGTRRARTAGRTRLCKPPTQIGVRLQTLSTCAAVASGILREPAAAGARFVSSSRFARLGMGMSFNHVSLRQGTQATAAATLAPDHWSSVPVVRSALGTGRVSNPSRDGTRRAKLGGSPRD